MVMKPEPFFAAVADLKTEQSRVILLPRRGAPSARPGPSNSRGKATSSSSAGITRAWITASSRPSSTRNSPSATTCSPMARSPPPSSVDAVVRLLPGVLGDDQSAEEESFAGEGRLLEAPHYTRPAEYAGLGVPPVLLSGNHGAIAEWRRERLGSAPGPTGRICWGNREGTPVSSSTGIRTKLSFATRSFRDVTGSVTPRWKGNRAGSLFTNHSPPLAAPAIGPSGPLSYSRPVLPEGRHFGQIRDPALSAGASRARMPRDRRNPCPKHPMLPRTGIGRRHPHPHPFPTPWKNTF